MIPSIQTLHICSTRRIATLLPLLCIMLGLAGCNQELTTERDALKVQIERLHKQLAKAQAERAQWQAQHAEADQTLLTIRQELQTEIDRQTEALQQTQAQYEDKSQQLEAVQAAQRALRAEIGQLESDLAQLEHNLQNTQAERHALQAQCSEVQSDLELAQSQRDEWQNRYHEAAQTLKTLQVELSTARQGQSGDEAQHALATQLVQRDTELAQLRAQYEMSAAELQSIKAAEQTRTTDMLDQLEQALNRFQGPLAGKQQEGAHQQNGHEVSATETLAAMREELTALKQVFETTRASQSDMRSDLQTVLRQELDTLKTAMKQETAQQFEAAQTALQTQLAQHQLELTSQQERLEQMSAERETLAAQRRQLETALNAMRDDRAQCQTQQANTAQDLDAASQTLMELKKNLSATQQELNRYKSVKQSQQHRLNHLYEVTAAQLQTSLNNQTVALEPGADRMLLRVGGSMLFEPGQVILRAEGRQTLEDVAAILKTFPNSTVRIEGHTDDRPIKGATIRRYLPTNWELSAVRAASAARYLETRGVTPERMIVSGASFHRPLASNDTPEGRTQNRRLEITIRPN